MRFKIGESVQFHGKLYLLVTTLDIGKYKLVPIKVDESRTDIELTDKIEKELKTFLGY